MRVKKHTQIFNIGKHDPFRTKYLDYLELLQLEQAKQHFSYRERRAYFKVWHNYFDLPGIVITLCVLPLRFAEVKAQWSLAAIGYIFNFLRLLKYSNVTRYFLKLFFNNMASFLPPIPRAEYINLMVRKILNLIYSS